MRLITFLRDGNAHIGGWIDQDRQIVDLTHAAGADPAFSSMVDLIAAGPETWSRARSLIASPPAGSVVPTTSCKILAPLPRPTQIRDCLCFPEHLRNASTMRAESMIRASADPDKTRAELKAAGAFDVPKAYYDFPLYYVSNRMTISGPDEDVTWPAYSQTIDYEMEWAAVIGRECHEVGKETARDFIFGFTIFNDWSARDEQFRAMQGGALNLGPARGKDFCNGVGPCIVTTDEIPDPYALDMKVRVNGQEVSKGNSSGMHFKFEDLLAFLSQGATLYPGELICSGTVGGGCSLETGQAVKPGDVIELEVEKIGVLRNRVLAPHITGR